jgi:hypothetical protein
MLQQASVLEHALCCEYLYAAFTLKAGGEPGVTPSQAALTDQWREQIMKISIQEMYHLMLASNLLTAIEKTPYFERPNFPMLATTFSDVNLPSLLTHFDLQTAKRFMCWEKPDVDGWWRAQCAHCADDARSRYGLLAPADAPAYDSIGALYAIIDASLKAHPDWIKASSAPRQLTSAVIPFSPKVAPITCYEDAHRYIDIIVTEGEGGPDWETQSHFAYFHQIVVQIQDIAGGSEGMAWPTVANPIYDANNAAPGANLVEDPGAAPIGKAFNDLYLVFVRMLARLFIPDDESDDERQALADTATAIMPLVIKPLGILLTRLPAGSAYPGRYAGPSFELPKSIALPLGARTEAIGALRTELAAVISSLQVLSITLTTLRAETLTELATIAARLQTLMPMMDLDPAPVA